MSSVNKTRKSVPVYTAEGGRGSHVSKLEELVRTTCACLLGEREAYEDGQSVKDRIRSLINELPADQVANVMKMAKDDFHLRHVPLFMATCLAEKSELTSDDVYDIINRCDDLTETLALYWEKGKKPLSKQLQKGLGRACAKFDEYQYGKYKGTKKDISMRDLFRIVHPVAVAGKFGKTDMSKDQRNALYKKVVSETLATPLTWETELSAGKDKKATWEMLLSENKLGGLAMLRNLRNMQQASVDNRLIVNSLKTAAEKGMFNGVMPYNFYTANKYSNGLYERQLEKAMCESAKKTFDELPGLTVLMIDTSGSMGWGSGDGEVTNAEKAGSLAAIFDSVAEFSQVYTFDTSAYHQSARGFELAKRCIGSGGTRVISATNDAIADCVRKGQKVDRVIVITDEQTSWSDGYVSNQVKAIPHKYIVNVASNKVGIKYGDFNHITGFSDGIFKFIAMYEKLDEFDATKPRSVKRDPMNSMQAKVAAGKVDTVKEPAAKTVKRVSQKAEKPAEVKATPKRGSGLVQLNVSL